MQKYEAIENAIEKKDIAMLRESLGSLCYTSRDFSSGEFDRMLDYVESKGLTVKEASLVGSPLISLQKNTYTDDDFAMAIFELKENFCNERIHDVKTIGKNLYGTISSEVVENSSPTDMFPNQQSHQNDFKKQSITTVTLVAGILIAVLLYFLLIER